MNRVPNIDDLGKFRDPQSPVLRPESTEVLYCVLSHDEEKAVSQIHAFDFESGAARTVTDGQFDTAPAISADGRHLAFVRKGEQSMDLLLSQLTESSDDVDPRILTSSLMVIGDIAFSPNGTHIAFTVLHDDGPADTKPPIVVDEVPEYKLDGLGFNGSARSQVFIADLTTGIVTQITTGGHCAHPTWSPDGTMIAFSRVRSSFSVMEVGLATVEDGIESLRIPWSVNGVSGPLTWTPDGSSVIAIGHLGEGIGLNRIVRLNLPDGTHEVLATELDKNVMGGGPGYPGGAPAFGADGLLRFCVRDGGQSVLHSIDMESGQVLEYPISDTAVISGLSISGMTAVMRIADRYVPGELVFMDLNSGSTRQLTNFWAEDRPDVAFIAYQDVQFTISDGTVVHGWLLRADDVQGPAPTLLDIHGGPHNAWTGVADTTHVYHQVLADQGWNVLMLNPRGSDGYGERFYGATYGAWGEGDEADFLEPLDRLVADGVVDPERVAVTGYSYGGFMTCWLSSRHPERFSASVPGGLICDLKLSSAAADIGSIMNAEEIGAGNELRLSPLTSVDAVTAPTLVLHGQNDQRCTLDQAELWYSAVRSNGVESRLVVYPGGSHLFVLNGPLSHRRDYNERLVDWVTRHSVRGS